MSLFKFKRQTVSATPPATRLPPVQRLETDTRVSPFDAAAGKSLCFVQYAADATIVDANENFLAATGHALDALRGSSHASWVASGSAASAEFQALWPSLRQGETVTLRYAIVAKSDDTVTRGTNRMEREVWFQSTFVPVCAASGTLASVTEVATDITAYHEKQVEMQLELEARTAAQNITSIVSWADKKGDITDMNQMYIDVSKFPREELIGSPHSITRHPDMPKSAFKDLWNTIGHGKIWRGQIKNLAKDGSVYFVDTVVVPILGKNGKPQKYLGVRYELTKAELARQHMQGIVDALDKSLASIEFQLDGTIINANGKFCDAIGYTREELVGKHHAMLVEPAYRDSAEYRGFWHKLAHGEYQAGQFRRIGKDGREVWIQASYNPICDEMGRPVRVIKYATDVTEQVKAKAALEEAVKQTQDVVKSAQGGDLTQRIELDGKAGSIRALCAGVNDLVENMAGVVGRIKSAASTIDIAAREIAAGNTDLSSRTEEQAASLEETASSMEELTSTVRQNAENAKQANQLAIGASDVATKGGQVVAQVVSTMSSISDASKKIAEIISVIDGIAFQTNILALNAAVEAARAGEQGRGFAVVASEVRSLAQRSAGAAKEIKALINDSVERVGAGSRLVEQAGATMHEIVTSVKRVTDIMAEISAASQEQSQGIEQVNTTITQMDEVTQQNAALVEQASASAKSLEEQADGLSASVHRFRIDAADDEAAPTVAPARPAIKPVAHQSVAKLHAPHRAAAAVRSAAHPVARTPLPPTGSDDQWTEF